MIHKTLEQASDHIYELHRVIDALGRRLGAARSINRRLGQGMDAARMDGRADILKLVAQLPTPMEQEVRKGQVSIIHNGVERKSTDQ